MLASHPEWSAEQVWQAHLVMHTNFQVLLNDNVTRLSALRYGDAKTLPAIDVLLPQGFDSLVNALKQGLDIRYNTRERCAAHACAALRCTCICCAAQRPARCLCGTRPHLAMHD
jgi:hypothetical protein